MDPRWWCGRSDDFYPVDVLGLQAGEEVVSRGFAARAQTLETKEASEAQ